MKWPSIPLARRQPASRGTTSRSALAAIVLIIGLLLVANYFRPAPRPAAAAITSARTVAQQTPAGPPARARYKTGEYVGMPSCASDRCHGGPTSAATIWRKSYTLWLAGHEADSKRFADPHQHAYVNLRGYDPPSAGYYIVARLDPEAVKTEASYRAYLANRCDACHITASSSDVASNAGAYDFGVSCESCHGPAGGWLVEHTTNNWITMTDADKRRRNFQPLKDLSERATTCVGCHVGHPRGTDLNVDHDLIAAGHPRLNFDMRAYHEHLPEHWNRSADEAIERQPQVTFQVALWQEGRRAELVRGLELLEQRAARALQSPEKAIWPEFSEYSCYACHHELSRGGFRQVFQRASHVAGEADWGSWHAIYAEFLPPNVGQPLGKLATELNQSSPEPLQVVALSKLVRQELLRSNANVDGVALRQALSSQEYSTMDWDRAKRWWSAWLAATSGMPDSATLRDQMDLTFFHTAEGKSPMKDREYSGLPELRFQSPVQFDPAKFQEMRQQVMDAP